ncbi:uncharacterized protein LOC8030403 [Ixodes scapularis]|uniref:uncharacterized protein LOC8030403 n=1 Tax=Ixodes scapularis TaxID=6945 RepID=UPI001A9EC091|nr:uncharacterized protein LOC8030403 [Ixodes scapularis]
MFCHLGRNEPAERSVGTRLEVQLLRRKPKQQKFPEYYGPDEEDGVFYDKVFRKRSYGKLPRSNRPALHPERHERCDDDQDCRRSPSQICTKRAREPFGRCQCPYYRPVEVVVDGVVRCVPSKDLFDECSMTQECTGSNPYLKCVNRLCVCISPNMIQHDNECGPGSSRSMLGWLTWIIPLTVALAGVLSSSVWFISKRYESSPKQKVT